VNTERARICSEAQWGVDHAAAIDYPPGDVRPGPIPIHQYAAHELVPRLVIDCSEYADCCYFAAAAPDPCGRHYDGLGNTDSMLENPHLARITRGKALPADLVVFGPTVGDSVHVVILKQAGSATDPLCYSMGQQSGPSIFPLSVEIAAHPGHAPVFLSMGFPANAATRWEWTVRGGGGNVLAIVDHPARWGLRHHGVYRAHADTSYHRKVRR
jgi:hypothetical protein